jgi:hypothetical protein
MEFRDRGNKKWTAMFIPEHKKMISDLYHEEKRKVRPELDEHTIEEYFRLIQESMERGTIVSSLIFGEFEDKEIKGKIKRVDTRTQY